MVKFKIGNYFEIGKDCPLFLIAGPCVIEGELRTLKTAELLIKIVRDLNINFIFKSSYDKANRSSVKSYRGPGLTEGLKILKKVKEEFDVPVLSDVHRFEEIGPASEVLDVLQIPAFLCRQTDLLVEVAKTEKVVNVKKGQFLSPWDVKNIIDKVLSTGNNKLILTERGTTFGYNNLVVDFRSFPVIRSFGFPVVYDATHSIQKPGGLGDRSGGDREMIPYLLRSAVACGVDGIFMEVHEDPDKAYCDGPNSFELAKLERLLKKIIAIDSLISEDKNVN
ncbi:MAG: 3-deoxy-8-phosphooctulonate synthase [Proteobacteria bacterium]|nr:3-deoxy-8-phosphooctulonate synthase [Pseudomonadota bacterium]